jgi:uncharacterized protein (DUF885 family)
MRVMRGLAWVPLWVGCGFAMAQNPAPVKSPGAAGRVPVCTAAGAVTPPPCAPVSAQDGRLQAIYKADEAWRLAERGAGDPAHPDKILSELHLVDAAAQQKRLEHWQGLMTQLAALKPAEMSEPERVNYEVYRAQIVGLLNNQKFKEYEKPVNSDSTFWSGTEGVVRKPFRTEQDYQNYLSWLADLPRFFAENVANMRVGLKRGFTPPKVTLVGRDETITPTANAKTADQTVYWKPFVTMPAAVTSAEQARLRAEAKRVIETQVIPAYGMVLSFWKDEYVPHAQPSLAAEDLPDGKAYYKAQILEYTTLDMTPEEIHAIGLSELAKIHQEMLDTMAEAKFDGDLPAFLKFLRTDPQFYAKTPDELLMRAAFIAKEFDGKADKYFGYMPRRRFAITPVPPEIAPYYTSGRGGVREYLVNTFDLPTRGLYSLPALTLHESAPGHSWQGAISLEHQDLPKFRNSYISAYGEGWALYCERLGTEMGMYRTPYEKFGMLSYQAWRAARLVIDTGLHAQGWTREQAQQYLRENTALSEHEIETEIDRYISWPAQALSYYLGQLEILKERKKAEEVLGAKFNIRAFHDAVLETGSVPLPVLDDHLEAWIKGGGVGPYPDVEK